MPEEKSHDEKKDENFKFEISKIRLWQGISAILAIVIIFIWLYSLFGSTPNAEQPVLPQEQGQVIGTQDMSLDNDPVLGNKDAPIAIVSFEDFQCPYCARAFEQTFPLIKKDYIDTGKVKYVFRDYPLPFHPNAAPAAEASECAHEQGKFWEYHEALYSNQQNLGNELYLKLAGDLKLDANKFKQCLDSGKYRQEVQDDLAYGSQAKVTGTPTFFVLGPKESADIEALKQMHDGINLVYGESSDGKSVVFKLVGALPYQVFQQVIEAELAK